MAAPWTACLTGEQLAVMFHASIVLVAAKASFHAPSYKGMHQLQRACPCLQP